MISFTISVVINILYLKSGLLTVLNMTIWLIRYKKCIDKTQVLERLITDKIQLLERLANED